MVRCTGIELHKVDRLLTLSRLNYGDKKCPILMYIPLKNHNMFGLADRNRNTIVSSKAY